VAEDGAVLRRILLAKALATRGARSVAAGDQVGRVVALIELHASIETTLRAIVIKRNLGADGSSDPGFVEMIRLIAKDSSAPKLPVLPEIKRINARRNSALHHAETLDQVTLDEYVRITRQFITESFSRFFSIDADQLSELEHVSDPTLKDLISIARELSTKGKVEVAISLLRLVLRLAAESCLAGLDGATLVGAG